MVIVKQYDPKCAVLAAQFLTGYGDSSGEIPDSDVVASLARAIQQAIEDWFEDHPQVKEK